MRTMIRRMIQRFMAVGCLTLIMSIQAEAAPALRGRFTVKQADGSLLAIEQFGDEYHHWTATTDGTIVINNGHGFFIAEIDEEGQLSATNTLAHEAGHSDYEELALIKKQATRRALFHEKGIETAHRALIVRDGKYLQHTGSPRILTILAAYKDLPFTVNNPVQAFNQVLNTDEFEDLGNKNTIQTTSVRKYFETCSYGKFSPQFDLVGPITLPENMDYYGGTSSSGSDDRFNDFCQDAINQAKDLVSDLNVYDCNGDGTIDLVCIIFAGFGQNQGGGANTIWAKSGFMNVTVNDQLKASLFCCSSELFHPSYPEYINGSGVFTHEFSHCLGLPDLYNTKANVSVNNQNMESYSVMDYGLYNHNGFSPCLYTAWEQEALGWTEIEDVTDLVKDEGYNFNNIMPIEFGGKAFKIMNRDNDHEYIIMENIQKKGINSYSYGHGLLVYHVNYPNDELQLTDAPNNIPGHPGVAVIPANGLFIYKQLSGDGKQYTMNEWKASMASATFPGADLVSSLTIQQQLPNFCFNNGDEAIPTGFMLTNITEDEEVGTVSFVIKKEVATGIIGVQEVQGVQGNQDDSWFTPDGRRLLQKPFTKGIYIRNGGKVIIR